MIVAVFLVRMFRMVMFMVSMVPGVIVDMGLRVRRVVMLMGMFVKVLVGVHMFMLVGMDRPVMGMFMDVMMGVLMLMEMFMGMVPFHGSPPSRLLIDTVYHIMNRPSRPEIFFLKFRPGAVMTEAVAASVFPHGGAGSAGRVHDRQNNLTRGYACVRPGRRAFRGSGTGG